MGLSRSDIGNLRSNAKWQYSGTSYEYSLYSPRRVVSSGVGKTVSPDARVPSRFILVRLTFSQACAYFGKLLERSRLSSRESQSCLLKTVSSFAVQF